MDTRRYSQFEFLEKPAGTGPNSIRFIACLAIISGGVSKRIRLTFLQTEIRSCICLRGLTSRWFVRRILNKASAAIDEAESEKTSTLIREMPG